jgi:3-oxoacyl-[acyl-carrier protein] reductase
MQNFARKLTRKINYKIRSIIYKDNFKKLKASAMNIDLSNKLALVTGASGEMGKVIAYTLAVCGADVVIHYYKNEESATKLMNHVKALGRRSMIVKADITDLSSINQMKEEINKTLGSPDIIVNNAVIQYQWQSVMNQDIKDYESQFKSSVMHNVYMAKAFVPAMQAKSYGRIIAINTECAMQNAVSQSAYVSGKRGMDGVLRVLAKEIGEHQITVNQVAPGWTITEKTRMSGNERQELHEKNIPLRRRGTDQEVANVVAFLASDLASYITGAFIPVCGGNVMPAI